MERFWPQSGDEEGYHLLEAYRADGSLIPDNEWEETDDGRFIVPSETAAVVYRYRANDENKPQDEFLCDWEKEGETLIPLLYERAEALKKAFFGIPPEWEEFFQGTDGDGNLFHYEYMYGPLILWDADRGEGVVVPSRDFVREVEVKRWRAGNAGGRSNEVYAPPYATLLWVQSCKTTMDGLRREEGIHSGTLVPKWFQEAEGVLSFKIEHLDYGDKVKKDFLGVYDAEKMAGEPHDVHQYPNGETRWYFWNLHRFQRVTWKGTCLFEVPVYVIPPEGDAYGRRWTTCVLPVSHLKRILREKGITFRRKRRES